MEKVIKKELLVIEDNKKYLENAKEAFGDKAIYVENYEDALNFINAVDKFLIDVYIPETKEIKLGKTSEEFYEDIEEKIRDIIFERGIYKLGTELKASLFRYAKYVWNLEVNSLEELGRKNIEKITKRKIEDIIYDEILEDYLNIIRRERKKGHAPLGILLAKKALEIDKKFVLVTDADHHDKAPYILNEIYFGGEANLVLGYGNKSVEIWKKAYDLLKE
ncbi:MAG: hypothetical protein QXL09_02565 [Candidatus Aenigmatarchaeota archaeon]